MSSSDRIAQLEADLALAKEEVVRIRAAIRYLRAQDA